MCLYSNCHLVIEGYYETNFGQQKQRDHFRHDVVKIDYTRMNDCIYQFLAFFQTSFFLNIKNLKNKTN